MLGIFVLFGIGRFSIGGLLLLGVDVVGVVDGDVVGGGEYAGDRLEIGVGHLGIRVKNSVFFSNLYYYIVYGCRIYGNGFNTDIIRNSISTIQFYL